MSTVKDRLTNTFGGCKNTHCACTIQHPFEDYQDTVLRIFDEGGESTQPVRIVSDEESYQLTVNNPANKAITIGKLDKCLFTDAVSKCDCLVTDNEQLFLVEIKTATSGQRNSRRKEAARQLRLTLQTLKDNGFSVEDYKATALICFKSNEPRIPQASRNTASAFFLLEMGVRLEEGNSIEFI